MAYRDDRLYELNDAEFEQLVVRICTRWLGEGVTPFATGKDGGRDGKFHGVANSFPSKNDPLSGHCVIQSKHVAAPNKSCSEKDFDRLLKGEHAKITRLVSEGIVTTTLYLQTANTLDEPTKSSSRAYSRLG